jgi:hypothetical protein
MFMIAMQIAGQNLCASRCRRPFGPGSRPVGRLSAISFGGAVAAVALSTLGAAKADSLAAPAINGHLAANPDPLSVDAGPLGTIYVGGVLSGFALSQTNHYSGDRSTRLDISNAQLVVQKTDGLLQFYVQAGQYDVLSLGAPSVSSSYFTNHGYEFLPQAYAKLAPGDNFSVEAGKLPTLIGDENTFSFQNTNMERGLLWNQTNGQTRGVQANYAIGPVALNLAWSDGYYSNRYSWLSGLLTWTIDPANTLVFMGAGNAGRAATESFITPLLQNNQQIYNLIYTRTDGPWTLQPYVQYSHVPENPAIGIDASGETWSGALLAIYNIAPHWNLAGRVEYVDTTGQANLLYGRRSDAWSLTLTPTFQYRVFFVRGEASYVAAGHVTAHDAAFGMAGTSTNQFRALLETGVIL